MWCSEVSLPLFVPSCRKVCENDVYWPETQSRCCFGVPVFALAANLTLWQKWVCPSVRIVVIVVMCEFGSVICMVLEIWPLKEDF